MRRRRLLDSFAVLAWVQDEPGAGRVEAYLRQAQRQKRPLLLNVVNLGEVYYRLARRHGHGTAQNVLRQLEVLPLEFLGCDRSLALEAAKIKADFSMAYADAFAVATAVRQNASVVTGDPEFRQVEHLVTIDWLRREVLADASTSESGGLPSHDRPSHHQVAPQRQDCLLGCPQHRAL